MEATPHIPVLLNDVLHAFKDPADGYIIDCTLGYAGHSSALLKTYNNIALVGIDRDDEALNFSKQRLADYEGRYTLYKGSFADSFLKIQESPIVGVLADFGVSSLQLDKAERGFSFESDTLDMRMDQNASLSAYNVVNDYSQEKLTYIFQTYGEIPQAEKLAKAIIHTRIKSPIISGKSLSKIAQNILPKGGKIHPATLMFQAIRIEVNDELGQIERLLDGLEKIHPSEATIALITFHSLEDRLIKNRFKAWSKQCICSIDAMRCTCGKNHAMGKIITKKPIVASAKESQKNRRSRSAKLRIFKFKRYA